MEEKNLIENHPRFLISFVKRTGETLAVDCIFDQQNLTWSRLFHFDSLSMKQQLCLTKNIDAGINGPLLWMYSVLESHMDSSQASVAHKKENHIL